jgi:hypothetical protein
MNLGVAAIIVLPSTPLAARLVTGVLLAAVVAIYWQIQRRQLLIVIDEMEKQIFGGSSTQDLYIGMRVSNRTFRRYESLLRRAEPMVWLYIQLVTVAITWWDSI